MTDIPASIDRMPVESRKPRAGPLLDPDEVIMTALNGVPYKWWRTHKNEPPLSETSEPVRAVLQGLKFAGYEIVAVGKQNEG